MGVFPCADPLEPIFCESLFSIRRLANFSKTEIP